MSVAVEGQTSWPYFPHTKIFILPSAERHILEQSKTRKALIVHTNDTNGLHNRALGLQKGLDMRANLKKSKSDFRVNRILSLQVFHSLPIDTNTKSNHM